MDKIFTIVNLLIKLVIIVLSVILGCSPTVKNLGQTTLKEPSYTHNYKRWSKEVGVFERINKENLHHWIVLWYQIPNSEKVYKDKVREEIKKYVFSEVERLKGDWYELWQNLKILFELYSPEELKDRNKFKGLDSILKRLYTYYSVHGDEKISLILLKLLVDRGNKEYESEYKLILEWIKQTRDSIPNKPLRSWKYYSLYYNVALIYPDQDFIQEAIKYSVEMREDLASLFSGVQTLSDITRMNLTLQDISELIGIYGKVIYTIVGLLLYTDHIDALKKVTAQLTTGQELNEVETTVLKIVEKLEDPKERKEVLWNLARIYFEFLPEVARRICHKGEIEYANESNFKLCLGVVYATYNLPQEAFFYFKSAIRLNPKDNNSYHETIMFVQEQIDKLMDMEDIEGIRKIIEETKDIVSAYNKYFPQKSSPLSLVELAYFSGLAEFFDGNIDKAIKFLEEVIKNDPKHYRAIFKLGEIYFNRKDFIKANEYFQKLIDILPSIIKTKEDFAYWYNSVIEYIGDIYRYNNKLPNAIHTYKEVEHNWIEFIKDYVNSSYLETAYVRLGIISHKLQKDKQRDNMLAKAIANKELSQGLPFTILSFLSSIFELKMASRIYKLVLNDVGVSEQWKTYGSLWMYGLANYYSDELMKQYVLEHLEEVSKREDKWVFNIAKYYTGKISLDELRKLAVKRGQQVEVDFYEAYLHLKDKPEYAKTLLQRVVESEFMGYYEYNMAKEILFQLGYK